MSDLTQTHNSIGSGLQSPGEVVIKLGSGLTYTSDSVGASQLFTTLMGLEGNSTGNPRYRIGATCGRGVTIILNEVLNALEPLLQPNHFDVDGLMQKLSGIVCQE